MKSYEECAEAFEGIIGDFGIDPDPTYNEADTRAKIIDRVLNDALGWPELGDAVRREEHVHEGYLDYRLRAGSHGLILEAKRVAHAFVLLRAGALIDGAAVRVIDG